MEIKITNQCKECTHNEVCDRLQKQCKSLEEDLHNEKYSNESFGEEDIISVEIQCKHFKEKEYPIFVPCQEIYPYCPRYPQYPQYPHFSEYSWYTDSTTTTSKEVSVEK